MVFRIVFLMFSFFVLTLPSIFADEGAVYRAQVQDYVRAVNSGNEQDIQVKWQSIVNNPEAMDYLKTFRPRDLLMLQAHQLLQNIEAIEQAFEEKSVALQPQTQLKPPPLPVEEEEIIPRTNGEIALERARIPLVDNQFYALNYPNQNKRTNQEIISSRLDRLYRQIQERFE